MTKKTITLYVIYGSWSTSCRIHVFDNATGKRLGDNRASKYGLGLGRAGSFKAVDCKRCRKRLDALIEDPNITVVDGWTGVEAV